ncbi:MAG: hypothetical protein JW841_02960 [Deltaproteobacteria bacterium]|nr:hypothetical protein [Deltaproteobacteria bacterium]
MSAIPEEITDKFHPIVNVVMPSLTRGKNEPYAIDAKSTKGLREYLKNINNKQELYSNIVELINLAAFFDQQLKSPGVSHALINAAQVAIPILIAQHNSLDKISNQDIAKLKSYKQLFPNDTLGIKCSPPLKELKNKK